MTDTTNTTPLSTAKQLNPMMSDDRLTLRRALDHLEDALKADWQIFLRRANLDTDEGRDLGHVAAQAWSLCIEALREIIAMETAEMDVRSAAAELTQTSPEFHPHVAELNQCHWALQALCDKNEVHDRGLYDLLDEAFMLNHVHHANMQFIQKPQVN